MSDLWYKPEPVGGGRLAPHSVGPDYDSVRSLCGQERGDQKLRGQRE